MLAARAAASPPLRELLGYGELAAALLAGGLWYLYPGIGLRPLLLVAAIWLVGLVGQRLGAWDYRVRTPLDLPLVFFIATAAVGLWATYHPDSATAYQPFDNAVGWQKFGLILAAALIYYALAHLPVRRGLWLATASIGLAGAVAGIYFLLSHDFAEGPAKVAFLHRLGLRIQAARPALELHQFGPNQVGSVTAMAFPLALQLALAAWSLHERPIRRGLFVVALALSLALLALIGFSLLLTVSRGAWLALAAALFVWAAFALTARLAARWNARYPDRDLQPVELLAVPAILVLLLLLLARPLVVSFLQGFLGPGINRLELMRLSTLLIRDYPFTGVGLGAYSVVFSTYVLLIHVPFIGSPHNLYIEIAAEQGVPGLLAWLSIVTATLALAWRTHRAARPSAGVLPLAGAVSMLLVLLLHGLVDDPLYARRVALLLLLAPMGLIAAAWRLSDAGEPAAVPAARGPRRLRGLAAPAIALALVAAALLFRTPLAAAWHANLGALAQTRVELALYDPQHFSDLTLDAARRLADISAAEAHLRAALALVHDQPTAATRLSQLARARGDYAGALALLEPSVAAGAHDRVTRLVYGDALVANGQPAAAAAYIEGLPFARSRLLGQAGEYRTQLDDARRAAWANEAAALVSDDVASPAPAAGAP